jgi:hypothetical protein
VDGLPRAILNLSRAEFAVKIRWRSFHWHDAPPPKGGRFARHAVQRFAHAPRIFARYLNSGEGSAPSKMLAFITSTERPAPAGERTRGRGTRSFCAFP